MSIGIFIGAFLHTERHSGTIATGIWWDHAMNDYWNIPMTTLWSTPMNEDVS